jgi:hypothetical protein
MACLRLREHCQTAVVVARYPASEQAVPSSDRAWSRLAGDGGARCCDPIPAAVGNLSAENNTRAASRSCDLEACGYHEPSLLEHHRAGGEGFSEDLSQRLTPRKAHRRHSGKYELPRRHDLVAYAFDVDRQRYTGAHASESCNSTAKGQHISVYYDAQNPAENTTDDLQSDLNEGFLSIVLEGVIVIDTCSGNMSWRCPARISSQACTISR